MASPTVAVAPHQDTPRQAAQGAEAVVRGENQRLRGEAPIPAGETAAALDVPGDGAPQNPADSRAAPAPQPQGDEPPAREPPRVGGKFDSKRAEITARFRTVRNEAPEEQDQIADFTRSGGMPDEFKQFDQATGADAPQPGAEPQPEPAAAAPESAPAPQTHKVKVNGQEKELTTEELIAKAQIALASENILDEVKRIRNEVLDARNNPPRQGMDGHHAAPQNGHHADLTTHPAEQTAPADPALGNQEDPFAKVVEAIQFGDPAEAKTLLGNIIRDATKATTREEMVAARIRDDATAANRALAEFQTKHADIANDPKARAVIEADIFEQQANDLKALNVDFNRIRNDGRPATPADVAGYHQLLRSQGYNVSSPGQMLEKAHGNFLEWKGVQPPNPAADPNPPPTPPQPPQQQRSTAPKVEITVDRSARRQAAPPQPTRPAPAPAQQPQAPRDRSDVVQAMKDKNARLRGSSLGIR